MGNKTINNQHEYLCCVLCFFYALYSLCVKQISDVASTSDGGRLSIDLQFRLGKVDMCILV